MERSTTWMAAAAVILAGILATAPAGAQTLEGQPSNASPDLAATGFLLQGAIMVKTPLTGLGEMSLFYSNVLDGDLRIGWMGDSFALALKASFASVSDGGSDVTGMVKFGPTAEIFLWRSMDRRARVYALLGADFGALLGDGEGKEFVSGLDLGFGGCYFLHPNVTLGLELGSHTDIWSIDDPVFISTFFASAVLGFVVGS
jgi:hypothetical protein